MTDENSGVLTAGYDGTLRALDSKTLEIKRSVKLREMEHFSDMKLDPEGCKLFLGAVSGHISALDLETGLLASATTDSLELVHKMVLDRSRNSIVVSGHDFHAEVFHMGSLSYSLRILGPVDDDIVDLVVSKRNSTIIIGSASGSLIERDLDTGKLLKRVLVPNYLKGFLDQGGISSLHCDDDYGVLLTGCYKPGLVRGLMLNSLEIARIWELPNEFSMKRGAITEIAAIPSRETFVFGDSNGHLCVAGYDSDELRRYWRNEESAITTIQVFNKRRELLVGYRNGRAEVYSTDNWKLKAEGNVHRGPIVGAISLPIGFLALSSEDMYQDDYAKESYSDTAKCVECEEQVERLFWLCPECGERVYSTRCPSCRTKSRRFIRRDRWYGKCCNCGYDATELRLGR
ncbi:MAG: hypothetical protein R6V59_08150 [Dehalococcoidia bacterium]